MHPLNLIILIIILIFLIYYFCRKTKEWSSAVSRIKNKVKVLEDKVNAFEEVKKVNTKINKKKIKKVNDFLRS